MSPDGRWVLSRDGALWDVRERRELWKASLTVAGDYGSELRVAVATTGARVVAPGSKGDSLDPEQGALLHDDEGVFAGSRTAPTELRVRDRAAPLETRAMCADEVAGLHRAALGRDFVAEDSAGVAWRPHLLHKRGRCLSRSGPTRSAIRITSTR